MKQIPRVFSRLLMVVLLAAIAMGGTTGCKSKKKVAAEQAAAAYAKKIATAKTDLNAIIDGTTAMALDDQRRRVARIKAENFNDAEIIKLITLAEKEIDFKQAEMERKAEEERLRQEEEARIRAEQSKHTVIDNQLLGIAVAGSIDSANEQINLSLQQFATPDVPVLIIISQVDGINDYDRPTTAENFLNLLKDTKSYKYKVVSVKRDGLGKITELELLKNW